MRTPTLLASSVLTAARGCSETMLPWITSSGHWHRSSKRRVGIGLLSVLALSSTVSRADEWILVEAAGFGTTNNFAVLTMDAFDGSVYAGTATPTETPDAEIWKARLGGASWRQVTPSWAGTPRRISAMVTSGEHLYVGTDDAAHPAEIWRTRGEFTLSGPVLGGLPPFPDKDPPPIIPLPGTSVVVELWQHVTPLSNSDWGSDPSEVTSMAAFEGSLYLTKSPPLEIWRSSNGTDWERVIFNGFGDPDTNFSGLLTVFEDQLYVMTSVATVGGGGGCEIWRTPDGTAWNPIVASDESGAMLSGALEPTGFESVEAGETEADVATGGCISHTVFQDSLFVGTINHFTGRQIWRFDGTEWTDATPLIFDPGEFGMASSRGVQTLAVYGNRLFAGDRLVRPGFAAALYVTATAERGDWQIAGDAFGLSQGIEAMIKSRGFFYLSTTNMIEGGQVYRKVPLLSELAIELGFFDDIVPIIDLPFP